MLVTEIKVPNIGDFKDVEVIEVLVSEGQEIKKNDPLITIESDKSSVEIPSNFEGKIKSLNLKVGDKVSEGDLILILEGESLTKIKDEEKQNKEKDLKEIKEIKLEIEKTNNNQTKTLSKEISNSDFILCGEASHGTFEYYDARSKKDKPTWLMVDVKYKRKLKKIITLKDLKSYKQLSNMRVVQRGNRLSITEVNKKDWEFILKLEK